MIERLLGWIIRVIQGWYNWLFTKPSEETLRRREICRDCKYRLGNFCGKCGCPILQKTASPDEKCLMNKWE